MSDHVPVYRLPMGRPTRGNERKHLNYRTAINVPQDLMNMVDLDLADPEVGLAISGYYGHAAVSDFARAGMYLLHLLLGGPTRARTLALINERPEELSAILAHLAFKWAKDPDPEYAQLYRIQEGVTPPPPGEAPLEEATPWHNI